MKRPEGATHYDDESSRWARVHHNSISYWCGDGWSADEIYVAGGASVRASAPVVRSPPNAFLLADLHRAQHRGDRSLDVPTVDLAALLARLEALEAREAVARCAPVGWAPADKLEAMRRGARKYLTVALYKSDKFDTHVGVLIDERV